MKIALLFTGADFLDPSEFPPHVRDLARANGVKIENRHSNMLDETYDANICPHCDSMFGRLFLSQYWYEEDSIVVPISAGI